MVDATFNQANLGLGNGGGIASGYESSSSYSNSATGYDATSLGGAANYGAAGLASGAGYESSSFASESNYESTVGGAAGYGAAGLTSDAGYNAASSNFSSSSAVQRYPTDAQGLFQDSNPQIIRRPAPNGNVTYTQNIRVRFLQPPPVPPPGVSYICFH